MGTLDPKALLAGATSFPTCFHLVFSSLTSALGGKSKFSRQPPEQPSTPSQSPATEIIQKNSDVFILIVYSFAPPRRTVV